MDKANMKSSFKKLNLTRGLCKFRGFLILQLILGLSAISYLVTQDASRFGGCKPGPVNTYSSEKTSPDSITSAFYSCYRLVTPSEQLTKGSLLHFVIEAHDESQQRMPSGGDFFMATMSSNRAHVASTAGKVFDHDNGTYSVYFYAAWSGSVVINITLVHPSKAVSVLHNTMWNIGPKVFWSATFKNMTSPLLTEKFDTVCWVESLKEVRPFTCKYPAPKALGEYVFVCNRAIDNKCYPIDMIAINEQLTQQFTDEAVGGSSRYFQSKYFNQRLHKGPQQITISENTGSSSAAISTLTNNTTYSHGYWMNNRWTSFVYQKNHWTTVDDVQKCLRNKHMLLLGDSTSRQWAENPGLPDLLNLVNGIYRVDVPEFFFENEYPQLNLTVTYKFHPQTITKRLTPFRLYRYFVDILDSLPSDECANTIVVLSPWAHFPQWTRDSYTQRLVRLKEAVNRLKMRCPIVPIIVKGAHIREHRSETAKWGWSDYLLLQINILMKEIFDGTDVWFLDVWDMNLSYLSKKFVHMPYTVVHEELKLALAYICKR